MPAELESKEKGNVGVLMRSRNREPRHPGEGESRVRANVQTRFAREGYKRFRKGTTGPYSTQS